MVTDILDDLQWRGLLKDSTGLDDLRKALAEGQVTFYVGFDPTAASIHIGNLVQVLTARRLQLAGHKPLLLVGGATGLIGDPKDSGERTLNDPSVVAGWVERIRRQVEPFFDFDGPNAAAMVNNLDWTGPMSAIEFLRDVGKHFPVNRMLAKDIVKNRLESGISFTEFSYQLIQGNDFFELNQRHGCVLQFGGSDQWGNITSGVDYIRRRGAGPVHAFCTPLVTKADGTKFGKTEGGTIWLDAEMTTPYAFYQFWFNVDDRDVIPYLKYFSLRSREEIDELERQTAERPFARAAQKALAEELTTLLHGKDETQQVIDGVAGAVRPRGPRRPVGFHPACGSGRGRAGPRSPSCRHLPCCSRTPGWRPVWAMPAGPRPRAASTSTTSGCPTWTIRSRRSSSCTENCSCCAAVRRRSPASSWCDAGRGPPICDGGPQPRNVLRVGANRPPFFP